MPPEVSADVVGDRGFAGEQAIAEATTAGWLRISEAAPPVPELPDLDEGEAACIRNAMAW